MVCLLKNKENKALLKKYAKIVGSEDAAYYLLAANNGFELDKTPNGEESALFNALIQKHTGDFAAAVLDKAVAYLPEYLALNGDWTQGKGTQVDSKGEPRIVDLQGLKICDSSSITLILQDNGKLKKVFELLEDENIIERFYPIGYAIQENRDIFIQDYLLHMQEIAPFGPLGAYIHHNAAREVWDKKKLAEVVATARAKLAKVFNLKGYLDQKTGRIIYETDDDSADAKLRVEFVNSLGGEYVKGKYTDKDILDSQMALIEIACLDGDATTFVHEIAHHYIRTFWNSEPVQQALKEVGLVGRDTSIQAEEKLVDALVDRLYGVQEYEKQNKSLKERVKARFLAFWERFNEMLHRVLGKPLQSSLNEKQNVLDTLAAYFAINKDLGQLQAELVFFVKELVPVFQSGAVTVSELDKSIIDDLIEILDRRIKSAEHASNYTPLDISSMKIQRNLMLSRNPESADDIEKSVAEIIGQCNKDLADLAIVIANAQMNGVQNLDIKSLMQLKVDVLGYYGKVLGDILLGRMGNTNIPALQQGSVLWQNIENARNRLDSYRNRFDSIIGNYIDHTIDVYGDYLMDFGDKEIFKQNMKYWARNQILNGGLSMLEKYLGSAITSRSPIIRLMDYMVREAKGVVQRESISKAHELSEVYSKLRKPGSDLLSLKNYMKNFIELDEDGKPTGNFIREYNYGRVQSDIRKATIKIAKRIGIELDENLKPNPSDPKFLQFSDALDDWYEQNPDILRRYKPAYYKARRRYLSRETMDAKNALLSKIDVFVQRMTDPVTGVLIPSRLTAQELDEYRQLLEEKENMASIYIIQKDDTGKIIRFEKKDPSSIDYKIAQELTAWNNFLKGLVKYKPNKLKYQADLQKLINEYGANSPEVKSFEYHFTAARILDEFYKLLGNSGTSSQTLQDLYARRAAIVNSTKPKSGYYSPNLSLLNDDAWAELKSIDELIVEELKNLSSSGQNLTSGNSAFSENARKSWVKHYENGVATAEDEIKYLEEQARRNSQLNPNALLQFYDKYYYKNAKGKIVPLSAFSMTLVNQTSTAGIPLVDYQTPISSYTEIDPESALVEEDFDTSDKAYVQPRKSKSSKYYNSDFEKISGNAEMKAAYDKLIKTMREALAMIPGADPELAYQMPQMRDTSLRRWARHGTGRLLGNAALKMGTLGILDYETLKDIDINETDTEYNEEYAMRPDGTYVSNIPLRWMSRLQDPRDISTDVFGTVAMFYEMACNYRELEKIEPTLDAFSFYMKGGFSGDNNNQTDQSERLETYIDMYIHGRMRKGFVSNAKMSKMEVRFAKLSDALMSRTHSKLMGHNWRTVLKNLFDSGWNLTKEIFGGKYFTVGDAVLADGLMFREIYRGTIGNLGYGNTKSVIGGLMQYNGVEGSIRESFGEQRSSWLRRVLGRHINMGEYSLVDYTFKGNITAMVYYHHRAITNPLTHKKEFMNQEQAVYTFIKAGYTELDGIDAWKESKEYLLDAYELSKNGNIVLKPEYEDIVRPYIPELGRRSNKLETRIATIIKERSSVINGVLDSMDRSSMSQNYLGAMALQMRGWMVSQSLDNFKTGNDFGDYYSIIGTSKTKTAAYNEVGDLGALRGQANISTGYLENGAQRGLFRAYKKAIANILHINRFMKSDTTLSRQERYQLRMMNVSFLAFAITVALGVLLGKAVEDDEDDGLATFLYAVNTGAMQERTSGLPFGIGISMLELLRSPGAVTAMYNDSGSIFDLFGDGIDYAAYQIGWSADTAVNDYIDRGAYQGLEKYQRDILKASSVLIPDLSLNNIYKNTSKDANMASARWYNQQFPVNFMNYIPQIGSTTKSNPVTQAFNDVDLYSEDSGFYDYIKDLMFSAMER